MCFCNRAKIGAFQSRQGQGPVIGGALPWFKIDGVSSMLHSKFRTKGAIFWQIQRIPSHIVIPPEFGSPSSFILKTVPGGNIRHLELEGWKVDQVQLELNEKELWKIYIFINTHIYIYVYIYILLYICVCVRVCIYIYLHRPICTYIFLYL